MTMGVSIADERRPSQMQRPTVHNPARSGVAAAQLQLVGAAWLAPRSGQGGVQRSGGVAGGRRGRCTGRGAWLARWRAGGRRARGGRGPQAPPCDVARVAVDAPGRCRATGEASTHGALKGATGGRRCDHRYPALHGDREEVWEGCTRGQRSGVRQRVGSQASRSSGATMLAVTVSGFAAWPMLALVLEALGPRQGGPVSPDVPAPGLPDVWRSSRTLATSRTWCGC